MGRWRLLGPARGPAVPRLSGSNELVGVQVPGTRSCSDQRGCFAKGDPIEVDGEDDACIRPRSKHTRRCEAIGCGKSANESFDQEPLVRTRSGDTVDETQDPAAFPSGWDRATVTAPVQGDWYSGNVEPRVGDANPNASLIGGQEDEQARRPTCGLDGAGRTNGRRGPDEPGSK